MAFQVDWLKRLLRWIGNRSILPARRTLVTRYIISKSQRWKEGGFRLKPAAFLPRRNPEGRWELSVFKINDLTDREIWDLAREHVLPRGRSLHGRGDLTDTAVRATKVLHIEFDNSPPRHGNILSWPDEIDDQLALAQELAEQARHVPPSG